MIVSDKGCIRQRQAGEIRSLIVETSGKVGEVALAVNDILVQSRRLDESRRHARDLAPAVAEMLAAEQWKPADVSAILVSRGPGSYTGLRVGIMSAKIFAFAAGASLIGVDTFSAIAIQSDDEASQVDVLADAQQGKVYVERFQRTGALGTWSPSLPLTILPFSEWLKAWAMSGWVSGPGLELHGHELPAESKVVKRECRDPRPASLLRLGLELYRQGRLDDPWTLEPLYLRPSAAEEKWAVTSRPR
jgi:tRNA threonylcarbamoyladenosine biosynthesis protein TsaB